jgi:hypothetical protein
MMIFLSALHTGSGVHAQTGGGFEITEAVVTAGGEKSSAGIFEVDATVGQPASGGPIGAGEFGITSGFWNFTSLAPTAAGVAISGRVLNPTGSGVLNAIVLLHTQDGELRTARSSSLGYYRFDDIQVGQSVFISVESKLFVYQPRAFFVVDELAGLDFIPEP